MKHGEITKLAKQVGITTTYMALIIKGKKVPSPSVAFDLEQATSVDRRAWLYPNEFPNPLIDEGEKASNGN
jgi:plasmid maintenance system antidote protein VapI